MKKLLLLGALLLSGCGSDTPEEYHGIKYHSVSNQITLPLVAFEDNTRSELSGYFVICYKTQEVSKYRVLVEFPDGSMKVIEFSPSNLFIRYGRECTMTATMIGFKYGIWNNEVTLEVPKECIRYENMLDGK